MKKIVLLMISCLVATLFAGDKYDLKIVTGSKNLGYHATGIKLSKIVKQYDIDEIGSIKVKTSKGSEDNLKKIAKSNKNFEKDSEIVIGISQDDAYASFSKQDDVIKIGRLFPECLYPVVTSDSNIDDDDDMEKSSTTVFVGKKGSGTKVTWDYITQLDKGFKDASIKVKSSKIAIASLTGKKNDVVLFMSKPGLDSYVYKKYLKSGKYTVASMGDHSLNNEINGEKIYHFRDVPTKKGFFSSGKKETICTYASVYAPADAPEEIIESIAEALADNSSQFYEEN